MTAWARFFTSKTYTDMWLDKSQRGEWTLQDQELYDATKRINPYIGMYEDRKTREWYMKRNDLDWSDVTQPWNLPGGSDAGGFSQMAIQSLGYVSHNALSLYEDKRDYDKRQRDRRWQYEEAWH